MLRTIFDVCVPRADVLKGNFADSDFAADLAQVLRGSAALEYQDPVAFFAHTHPTRGLRNLLKNISLRLNGNTGQVASIFRLDTNYGGGKTHALIALAHLARGASHVPNIDEFISASELPAGSVQVAAFDGENADPINGHKLEDGLKTYTPWGELAYALGGKAGYELVRKSDEVKVAPGADTLKELVADRPTLFLLDELSIYLRKQGATGMEQAASQLTAFLTALFKAVESSPRAALVYTLAIGKSDGKAIDGYSKENEAISRMMHEAESVSARKATLLDPTEEEETVKVLCRRLFESIDHDAAKEIVQEYARLWDAHKEALPAFGLKDPNIQDFEKGYPLHPELVETLKEKTSTLGNFQRVRGMLRLLARTVERLWDKRPENTYAIHLHHVDLSFSPIRQEIVTKLGQKAFVPALKADIAASEGDAPSLAEQVDAKLYRGMPPYASFVAKAIFLHTLAFNDNLKGVQIPALRYSILGPDIDISFIDDAIRNFRQESAFLDERPSSPLRFMVEPNLTQLIHQRERQIDPQEIRSHLNDTIKKIFGEGDFQPVFFPAEPNEIEDKADTPKLVVLGYEAAYVSQTDPVGTIPQLVAKLFLDKSTGRPARKNRNNLVFLVVEAARVEDMKSSMRRRLALGDMRDPAILQELAPHQQEQLKERYEKSRQQLAIAIQQTYRYLFYPSRDDIKLTNGVELKRTTIDLPNASANPGPGQKHIVRVLVDSNKLRLSGTAPNSPEFMIERTPLKKGFIATAALRNEYRENVQLPILADDDILVRGIRDGILAGEFVYQFGELVYGKGDPFTQIEINEQALVWTVAEAQLHNIWPRKVPPPPPPPPLPGPGSGSGPGATSDTATLLSDGPLNEAFTKLWDQVPQHLSHVTSMEIVCRAENEGFPLINLASRTPNCEKRVRIECSYDTPSSSTCQLTFDGVPNDIQAVQQFVMPQLRVSNELSKSFSSTIYLDFNQHPFELTDSNKNDFVKRLKPAGASAVSLKMIVSKA